MKNFAEKARPLHALYEKKAKFLWTPECQTAFDSLKNALISSPILGFPITNYLHTNASNKAVGAVLSQSQDGMEKVIAYLSKTMNRHERSYCVTRKEMLAVVHALRKFHPYLYGKQVAAVRWIKSLKNPSGQMARWLQEIENYDLKLTHRPGQKHQNADALSRNPCKPCLR